MRDVKYGMECWMCKQTFRLTEAEHNAHAAECEIKHNQKSAEERAKLERERAKVLDMLPRKPSFTVHMDEAKRLLAHNSFLGVLVRPEDTATESGLIIPGVVAEGDTEWAKFFHKTRYVRVISVSPFLTRDRHGMLQYPFMAEWRDNIHGHGETGPVVRIKTDAGVPMKGKDGHALLLLFGVDCLAEMEDNPTDD